MADVKEGSTVDIYIMGKKYVVPAGLTIMKAMEHAGYKYLRGCGCRGGFCGACGTVYRTGDSYKIKKGLACQTVVEDGMYLAQLPFFPANKAKYDVGKLKPSGEDIIALYPEIARCVSCNSCTKICPQDIEVMDYIAAALRGDVKKAAESSFDCIMCGLCASRCPGEVVQYNVGILCRRIYGKHILKKAPHVQKRLAEVISGKFDEEMTGLMKSEQAALKKLYDNRVIEEGD
jgi:formate hydrogenlyase subunit 6/NADH:ubiquinone oxidoreductase subunit I